MAKEIVRGKAAVIHFDGALCIHARHCVLSRPDVFVPNVKGEWIHPDAALPEEVADLAMHCPSGAIRYERLDGGPQERPPLVNTVRVRENGPLAIHADVTVNGVESGYRVTLCRCGASKNKPFCDGSHGPAAFAATGEPPSVEAATLQRRDGPLNIQTTANGPLHVSGNLELVSGTGRMLNKTSEVWLCRCGQSKNKPYCDGSHTAGGFVAE